MTGQNIGYKRVSSESQNTARQLDGIKLDKEFADTITGSVRNRLELEKCLNYLRTGDTLHIHSIDRLARNLRDLQAIVDELVCKGITVKFHNENLTFSGEENPVSKAMLQMMGCFAEFERSMIKSRQREGIDAAKAAGIALGRRPKLNDAELIARARQMKAGGMKKIEISKELGLSRPSVDKLLIA